MTTRPGSVVRRNVRRPTPIVLPPVLIIGGFATPRSALLPVRSALRAGGSTPRSSPIAGDWTAARIPTMSSGNVQRASPERGVMSYYSPTCRVPELVAKSQNVWPWPGQLAMILRFGSLPRLTGG